MDVLEEILNKLNGELGKIGSLVVNHGDADVAYTDMPNHEQTN